MSEAKTLVDHNYTGIIRQFQEHVQQGWEIDPNNAPDIWGIAYEVHVVRSDKTIAAMQRRAEGATEPKMTREQTLEVARAARAAKRAQEQAASQEQTNGD